MVIFHWLCLFLSSLFFHRSEKLYGPINQISILLFQFQFPFPKVIITLSSRNRTVKYLCGLTTCYFFRPRQLACHLLESALRLDRLLSCVNIFAAGRAGPQGLPRALGGDPGVFWGRGRQVLRGWSKPIGRVCSRALPVLLFPQKRRNATHEAREKELENRCWQHLVGYLTWYLMIFASNSVPTHEKCSRGSQTLEKQPAWLNNETKSALQVWNP